MIFTPSLPGIYKKRSSLDFMTVRLSIEIVFDGMKGETVTITKKKRAYAKSENKNSLESF